jgi:ArsR family transcriptional regulator
MGLTKSNHFSPIQNHLAVLAKALGHPARIAILEHLMKVDSCICSDLVKELPLAQPTISQHLKELKSAGLIKGSIDGNSLCYCLDEKAFDELKGFFNSVDHHFSKRNQSCC